MAYENEILAGAALLDSYYAAQDTDWRARINLDSLSLGSMTYCVLGQLFGGDFENGCRELGLAETSRWINWDEATAYGFYAENRHVELTEAWRQYLSRRKQV